ncbi:HD domain-containing protein [Acidaminobacter sp. JC074]|uniref:bis(5'-nucleosyl)-tetraphosphatase (symmetrical) YqeK n=1 Tax=Acidaminobacter sp. JC074 TaxID=2530199 RepID=UPI001F0D1B72|nr:bis(5'-nucleosyl)-tetraphosphatase (symmetrical) YqeK [Acidaminobacter sp. JC074]MCH4887991.1 HD domain-containing protein [Acidaminobacter sp. JC074]
MKYNNLVEELMSNNPIEETLEELCERADQLDLYDHMEHVASIARDLCDQFKLDPKLGYMAGLLHDVGKLINIEDYTQILDDKGIVVTEEELSIPELLHGKVSALVAKEVFHLDENTVSAIKNHTTLRKKPNELEKIIFIADKMTLTDEDFVDNISDLVFQNLNIACYNALAYIIDEVEARNGKVLSDTLEAYLFFKGSVLF